MSSTHTCPQCGTALPARTPFWLCPKCLLAQAAQPEAAEQPAPARAPPATTATSIPLGNALPCRLGAYELLERIGHGGMGVVYKARQLSLDRVVAVKIRAPGTLADREALQRFHKEAVTAGSLQHPNIVAVHEVGEAEGQQFLVMDFVPGPTLGDRVRNGPLPSRQAARYLRVIAEAVHFAHERGILHRDLKPSNVLIDQNDQPRVTDFGLAKCLGDAPPSTLDSQPTLSGQVLGSPAFIPPEQALGQRERIGRWSDVYALGAVFYQLLTGRPPFMREALADTLHRVVYEDPLRPRLLNPGVPPDLETICLKCLEKEPDRRYPTAQALAEELGRFLDDRPILARPLGRAGKTWRWGRRNPLLALATGAALSSLVLGLAGVTWQWRQTRAQQSRAEAEALSARRNAYAADMNLVQRTLEDHELGRARELLNRHRPAGKSEVRNSKYEGDVGGWEWRYLWSQCQGEERFILHPFTNAVWALTFSPDGKWLAVRLDGGTVTLWDAVTRQPVTTLPGVGRYPGYKALAFSPRRDLLAWGRQEASNSPTLCLWDLTARKESARLPHSSLLVSVAFSPDAKVLATLANDGHLCVWDLASQQVLTHFATAPIANSPAQRLLGNPTPATSVAEPAARPAEAPSPAVRPLPNRGPGHTDHCGCVLFSPDGRWLAVGALKPEIRLWDWAARREVEPLILPADADGITSLAFSHDGRWLAAAGGSEYMTMHVWDLVTRTERRLHGHQAWIAGLAFAPDTPTLASVSADQTLRLWDVTGQSGQTELRRLQGDVDEVWAVAWHPDGQNLATGARDGTVRFYSQAAPPLPSYEVLPAEIWPYGLMFLPDSRTFLTVGRREGQVVWWDATRLRPLETLTNLGTGYSCGALSKDGRWLALGVTNGPVRIWDFPALQWVTNLDYPEAKLIAAVLFSPGGRYLHCGAYSSTTNWQGANRTWELPSWREVDLKGIDFTSGEGFDPAPDDRTVARGYCDGTAVWWDLATGTRLKRFECRFGATSTIVKFSPDGRWFATAGRNGRITLWDVKTQRPSSIGLGFGSTLHGMAFSPDGRRLITAGTSPRGLVKIWDVATGRDVATLPGESGFFPRIDFSPDGKMLFANSIGGKSVIWRAPSWEEIERAEWKPKGP